MRLRTAVARDLPALRDVFRRAALGNAGDAPALLAHPEALVLPDTEVLAGHTRVAVLDDGIVVGFATVLGDGPVRELEDLFVDPDAQRRGIGAELVADAVSHARAGGATRLEVTGNPHAARFYERVGFARVGDARTEFGSGIRMHLDIAGRE